MRLAREKLEELRKAVAAGDTVVPVAREVLETLLSGYQAPGFVELLELAEEKVDQFLQELRDERVAQENPEERCDFRESHIRVADFRGYGPLKGTCIDCNQPQQHEHHRLVVICKSANPEFWAKQDAAIAARRAEREADQRIAEEGR